MKHSLALWVRGMPSSGSAVGSGVGGPCEGAGRTLGAPVSRSLGCLLFSSGVRD